MKTLFEYLINNHVHKNASERFIHTKLTVDNFDVLFDNLYSQYIDTKVQFFNDVKTGNKAFKYFQAFKTDADSLKKICKNSEPSITLYGVFNDNQLKNAFLDENYTVVFNFNDFINSFKNDINVQELGNELNKKKLFTFGMTLKNQRSIFIVANNPLIILNDLGDLDELLNTINEML